MTAQVDHPVIRRPMRFAQWVFTIAGVYGVLALAPQYFLEKRVGLDHPPAITHPEYFYGFVGVALAWQVLFLMIGRDPLRLRPAMLAAILEKLSFAVAVPILYAQGRVPGMIVGFASIDALLAVLFAASYWRTRPLTPRD
jgi:hypothetical protein